MMLFVDLKVIVTKVIINILCRTFLPKEGAGKAPFYKRKTLREKMGNVTKGPLTLGDIFCVSRDPES